jgi:hypothetical protein
VAGAPGILIVVGRDQGELYEYFRWSFGQTPGVIPAPGHGTGGRSDEPTGRHRPKAVQSPTAQLPQSPARRRPSPQAKTIEQVAS